MAGNSVPVYNRNGRTARMILNRVSAEDIGQSWWYCTLNVDVKSAYLKESVTPGKLHRLYLEINGSVSNVFIEDNDDRIFPCGSKSMMLDEPEDVRVMYTLSTSELHTLVEAGCYYSDFKLPENLLGNTMEIPGDIIYTCVYDTPIGMVSVNKPFEIETSTAENHYDNFFDTFPVSQMRLKEAQRLADLQNTLTMEELMDTEKRSKRFLRMNDFAAPAPAYESVIKDYLQDDTSMDMDAPVNVSEFEPDPEKNSIESFKNVIRQERGRSEQAAVIVDSNKSKRDQIVRLIREQNEQANAAANPYRTSGRRTGDSNSDQTAKINKMSYSEFKNAMINVSNLVNSDTQKRQDEEAKAFQAREDKLEAQRRAQSSDDTNSGKKQNREEDEFQKREDKLEAQRRFLSFGEDKDKATDSKSKREKQTKVQDDFQHREDKLEAQQRAMAESSAKKENDKKRSSAVSALLNLVDKNKQQTPRSDSPDYL